MSYSLGERLRLERTSRGETQAEVAKKFGIGQPSYCRWEADKANPSSDRIEVVAAFLDLDVADVVHLMNRNGPVHEEDLTAAVEDVRLSVVDGRADVKKLQAAVRSLGGEVAGLRDRIAVLERAVGSM